MTTFWNTKFTKRDYECTNIVAIKADTLPKGYDANVWKANGQEVKPGIALQYLGAVYQNGERFEQYGYL
jgi:hypothetical protein